MRISLSSKHQKTLASLLILVFLSQPLMLSAPPPINSIFVFIITSVQLVLCCLLCLPRLQHQPTSHCPSSPESTAVAPSFSSDIRKVGVMTELGGAEREACVGYWGGHVRVRRGWRWLERRLELMDIAGLMVRVDGWGGEEPVGVSADAQSHLVDYSASLGVGKTITVLEERRRLRGQDGVGVGSEGTTWRVGQEGVWGQALVVCVLSG